MAGDGAGTRVLGWWVDRHDRPWQFVTEGDYYALRVFQQGEWQTHESWVSWDEHGDTGFHQPAHRSGENSGLLNPPDHKSTDD